MRLDSNSDGPYARFADVPNVEAIPEAALEGLKPGDFFTEMGSVYHYRQDGRIQRFKTSKGELKEPFDVAVFLPSWEIIQRNLPANFPIRAEDETVFFQTVSNYLRGDILGHKGYIVDLQGNKIRTPKDLADTPAGGVFVVVDGKTRFSIPVFKTPQIGSHVFEMQTEVKENGERYTQRHTGHKVIHIVE